MPPKRILIAHHSAVGQTAKIADRIGARLRRDGYDVEVRPVEHAPAPDAFDAVAVGDSIHLSRHSRELRKYLKDHAASLEMVPTTLFQVSMTSAKSDEAHTQEARTLVDSLLTETGFEPNGVALFAGALDYTKYGWLTRNVMKWISRREGDDTDTSRDHEYTDWDAVDDFAEKIEELTDEHHTVEP